ncbi:MAG: ABC transporter ATP-binding protein [Candidatus Dadabacteria bacterium]|nr:ABC transporter ATP-binding protein [Candidatus Dadabacteria bacterium]
METIIECREVGFSYGPRRILGEITLSFGKGSMHGILGANGAGKSTLLKLLTGALRPEAGEVLYRGKPLRSFGQRAAARKIAYIPQDPVFAFPFTVTEVVLMGRAPYIGRFEFERESDLEMARRAMETVGISHLDKRLISEISSGERQLASIARALVQEPEVMILDEPATFLDIRHRSEIMNILKRLRDERGILIIAATHDIFGALYYFDEIIMIREGRVFAEGNVAEVVTGENLSALYGTGVAVRKEDGKVFVYQGD